MSAGRGGSLREVVEPVVRALGLQVEEATVTPAGRRRVVRISLDRDLSHLDAADTTSPVAPLSLDEVAEATRAVDAAVERAGTLGEAPYVLEVGSPGLSRPLTAAHHFRRNVGRLLRLTLTGGTEQVGRLVAASPVALVLQDESGVRREVPRSEVARARVEVDFGAGGLDEPGPGEDAPDDTTDDEPTDGEVED